MAVAADLDAGLLVIGADAAGCRVLGERRAETQRWERAHAPCAPGTVEPPARNYQAHPHHLTADNAIKPAATVMAEINTGQDVGPPD